MSSVRPCRADERTTALAIVNAAASAYRGIIPPDCWHEPYMSDAELQREVDAGVELWIYDDDGEVIGIMGVQRVRDVDLIRHAYVLPEHQRRGVGAALMERLRRRSDRPMLVGTWANARWAIGFYERHGFVLQPPERARELLRTYWSIPERQIETSVVLVDARVP